MMSSTTAPLPKERDPLWERATVGANTKETAESVNAAVLAVTGESGVAGDGRTVGNTLRSGPGALMGLPAEISFREIAQSITALLKSKEAGRTAAEQKNACAGLCNPHPPGFQAGEE
jgi:hypothetical protein